MELVFLYCTKCGNQLNNEDKFCTKCGMNTNDNLKNNPLNKGNKDNTTLGLIFGIISLLMFWFPIIGIPFAIIAIVNGKKYKDNTGKNSGSIVMGIIGIVLSIIFVIIVSLFIYLAFNYVDSSDSNFQEVIDKYFDDDYYDNDDASFDISGYSWRGNDSSMLYLNSDKSYVWYLDDNVHDNNFYTGTYEVYVGRKAVNYIANDLREYGITYEEQMRLFNSGEYDIEDYYLIILNCTDVYLDGKVDYSAKGIIPYYGFYDDDSKSLSLINMKTSKSAGFTLNAKISSADDNTL